MKEAESREIQANPTCSREKGVRGEEVRVAGMSWREGDESRQIQSVLVKCVRGEGAPVAGCGDEPA